MQIEIPSVVAGFVELLRTHRWSISNSDQRQSDHIISIGRTGGFRAREEEVRDTQLASFALAREGESLQLLRIPPWMVIHHHRVPFAKTWEPSVNDLQLEP